QNICEGFCSRARPARVLVNRREHDLFIIRYQCLGAIAMVCVEIPNRHPLNLPFYRGPWPRPGVGDAGYSESIKRRDRNVAEVTKPHRAIAQGMMTGPAVLGTTWVVKNLHAILLARFHRRDKLRLIVIPGPIEMMERMPLVGGHTPPATRENFFSMVLLVSLLLPYPSGQ